MAIAGLICSAVAIVVISVYLIMAQVAANRILKTVEDTDWNGIASNFASSLNVTISE